MDDFILYMLSNMSLKEKIGQMIYIDYRKQNIKTTEMTAEFEEILSTFNPGGFILFTSNISNLDNTYKLINDIQSVSEIKMFIGVDQEGGRVQRLKDNIGFDSIISARSVMDKEEAYLLGRRVGYELYYLGINMDMAPVLDIFSNPLNTVIGDRAYGSTSNEVSDKALYFAKGLMEEGIIPTGKHFPGHGSTSVDSHINMPTLYKTKEELYKLELIPFSDLINYGIPSIMVGHIMLPKIDSYPSTLSSRIITDILRKEMGFNGIVITDSLKMKGLTNYYNEYDIYYRCIASGNDIMLMPKNIKSSIDTIYNAVNDGKISIERINESVKRILSLKYKMGLLDKESVLYNKKRKIIKR